MVKPMNSGRIMERRDQVLIGRLSLPAVAFSTLANKWWSTNGPFLRERDIQLPLTSCDATRSCLACACCYGCGSPWSGYPMDPQDDAPRPACLHHRQGGGLPGSSPHLARSG